MSDADVLVIGGGLAGLATAIELADRGHDVAIVDDGNAPRPSLGESLEFSAPGFLADLGLDPNDLIARGIGYPKHNVFVSPSGGADFEIWPPGWFGRAPFFCSNATLHIDRVKLDDALRKAAAERGVRFLDDRVEIVEATDQRIAAVVTRTRGRLRARWFVDASGHRSRVVGRSLGLERHLEGGRRVAFYARLQVEPWVHATSLRFSATGDNDLLWAWAIPLSDQEMSFGVCVPDSLLRTRQPLKGDGARVFWDHLAGFGWPDLTSARANADVSSTSYTPFTHTRVSGPNWVLVGDAAALVDPVTSSGVATALRGAGTAARLIDASVGTARSTPRLRTTHHHATTRIVSTANLITDRVLFRRGLRRLIGLRLTIFVFAAPVLIMHSWYARLRPGHAAGQVAHRAQIATFRVAAHLIGLLGSRRRGPASDR